MNYKQKKTYLRDTKREREMLITTKLIDREMDKQTVKQAKIFRDREKKREMSITTQRIDRHTSKQINRKTSNE